MSDFILFDPSWSLLDTDSFRFSGMLSGGFQDQEDDLLILGLHIVEVKAVFDVPVAFLQFPPQTRDMGGFNLQFFDLFCWIM
jgi:hypothetical protein